MAGKGGTRPNVVRVGAREDVPGRVVLRGEARRRFVRPPSEEAVRRMEALERAGADGMRRMRDILVD